MGTRRNSFLLRRRALRNQNTELSTGGERRGFTIIPFFIILNVAAGGGWPGSPDTTTVFPQTMLVDYVRVYQREMSSAKTSNKVTFT